MIAFELFLLEILYFKFGSESVRSFDAKMNFWHQREGAYSLGSLKFIEYK
jgi:hypothetical protein